MGKLGRGLSNSLVGALGLLLTGLVGCAGGESDAAVAGDSANVIAGDAITLQNWQNHPKIAAVRAEVEAIDKLGLKIQAKKMCPEGVVGESLRQKGSDGDGRIRTLILQGGSDDSATTSRYYYDALGKARFLFRTRNDVHGNAEEQRVYFDEAGLQIWQVEKRASDLENGKPDLEKAPFAVPRQATELHPGLADPGAIFASAAECG
jgi:hypothetical protein